jgi:hypothetical protein
LDTVDEIFREGGGVKVSFERNGSCMVGSLDLGVKCDAADLIGIEGTCHAGADKSSFSW